MQVPRSVASSLRLVVLLVACRLSLVAAVTAEAAQVEDHDGLPVVYLEGSPYELGRQHGHLLRQRVRASVTQVLSYFRRYLKIPLVRTWVANWWLDQPWRQANPFIPPQYIEELRGLADGSGVSLRELARLHAVPDRTYACSSFAAWGRATQHGRLIHVRNLDWNIDAGIQQHPVIFVVRPAGKSAFVNVGWAGFIGVLTGINDRQLSIGQIGAETLDVTFRGEPMVFLMRRVLEEAPALEDAATLIVTAKRTIGANYILADARRRQALAIETTHHRAQVFRSNDPAERAVGYARTVPDAVFRADTAMDAAIRDRQVASHGDPSRPGLEDPVGSSAYDVRYLGQAAGLLSHYGQLDGRRAQHIAAAVAPNSNIQSVVFTWPDLWVANASGRTPAAQTSYHHFSLPRLFQRLRRSPEAP